MFGQPPKSSWIHSRKWLFLEPPQGGSFFMAVGGRTDHLMRLGDLIGGASLDGASAQVIPVLHSGDTLIGRSLAMSESGDSQRPLCSSAEPLTEVAMSLRTKGILAVLAVVISSAPASHAQMQAALEKQRDSAAGREAQVDRKRQPDRRPPSARAGNRSGKASDFVDRIKAIVRDRSGELCKRYGSEPNCMEEIEICFSMLDKDDDLMKICLDTTPEERGPNRAERTRLRR